MTYELGEYQAEQYRRRHPIPSAQGRTRRRPVPIVPPQPVRQHVCRPLPQGWRIYATPIVLGIIGITTCIIGIDSNYHHVHAPHQVQKAPSSGFPVGALVGDSDTQILSNKDVVRRAGERQFSREVLTHELYGLVPHRFSLASDPITLPDVQEPLLCEVKAWLVWPAFVAAHGSVNIYLLRGVDGVYEDPSTAWFPRIPDVVVPVRARAAAHTEQVPCPHRRFRVLVQNATSEPMAAGDSAIIVRVAGTE